MDKIIEQYNFQLCMLEQIQYMYRTERQLMYNCHTFNHAVRVIHFHHLMHLNEMY